MHRLTLPYPAGPRNQREWMLAGVSIASFLGCIDFTIVNAAIPSIQAALHAGVAQSQWIVTVFLIGLCGFMVVAGRLADLYGRRLVLYIGMAAFGLASLGAGFAPDVVVLIGFRFVQGLACAALYTASAAMVAEAFPEEQRGRAMGILFGANGLGLAIGPIAGGILTSVWGWRAIFLVNVPLILLSYLLCLSNARESRSDERVKVDWIGLVLLVPASIALLLAVAKGADWGWTAPPVLLAFGLSAVLLAVLWRWEGKATSPWSTLPRSATASSCLPRSPRLAWHFSTAPRSF